MFFKSEQAIIILIFHFVLHSKTDSRDNDKQDSSSLNNGGDENRPRSKGLETEFREFEEKLKRLKLMLAEDSHKSQQKSSNSEESNRAQQTAHKTAQQTTQQSVHPAYSYNLGKKQTRSNNFDNDSKNIDHTKAAKDHLGERMAHLIDILNPVNLLPTPDNMMKPFKAAMDITNAFIPEPFRFNGDYKKSTENFSMFVTRDIPQMLQRMPESLEGMVKSMDSLRMNSTQSGRNQTNLFTKISKHLFVWSVLMAETDLMAALSLGLVYRAYVQILKATPLPTEIIRLQTTLNKMTVQLSKTLPLTINVLSSGVNGDATEELNKLILNINETNEVMNVLQNQTNCFQEKIERIPTTANVFDKDVLANFQTSLLSLIHSFNKIPENIPLITSLFINQSEYLIRFLGYMSRIFTENGITWKVPENIKNMQKRLAQLLNLKDLPDFLGSGNPLGKAAINLLGTLQNLFAALQTSIVSPGSTVAAKPLIFAIDGCISSINGLKSVNVLLPPVLTEPLLISLEMMAKFVRIGASEN